MRIQYVMLLEVGANFTKAVICRHNHLLFARLVPIGGKALASEEAVKRLVQELASCARYFEESAKDSRIGRLIFLAGQAIGQGIVQQYSCSLHSTFRFRRR